MVLVGCMTQQILVASPVRVKLNGTKQTVTVTVLTKGQLRDKWQDWCKGLGGCWQKPVKTP